MLGSTKILKLILSDPNVDPSINNNAAMKEALEYEHEDIVKLLKSDPRYVDKTK